MTHTLHRLGTPENLKDDYLIVARCEKGINRKDSRFKLRQIYQLFRENHVVNYGDSRTGIMLTLSENELDQGLKDGAPINGLFRSMDDVMNVIKGIAEKDLGLCVVISGLYGEILKGCEKLKIKPHTVNNSLGIWGRTDLLPEDKYLELSTMCGHGMIGLNLIKDVIDRIKRKKVLLEEGAIILGKHCICGAFNMERAARLLKNFVPQK
jgi:hypothetical protein